MHFLSDSDIKAMSLILEKATQAFPRGEWKVKPETVTEKLGDVDGYRAACYLGGHLLCQVDVTEDSPAEGGDIISCITEWHMPWIGQNGSYESMVRPMEETFSLVCYALECVGKSLLP